MTAHMTWRESVEAIGAEILFDGTTKLRQARFQCASCPAHLDVTLNVSLLPDVLAKRAHSEGWTDKRQRWSCPGCSRPKKANGEAKMATTVDQTRLQNGPPLPGNGSTAPSVPALDLAKKVGRDPTIKETVEIVNVLEMYFDKAKGAYSNGKSDEVIARELNMPTVWVVNIRREGYGELRAHPEILAIRAELETLRNESKGLHVAVNAIDDKIVGLEARLRKHEERR